MEYILYNQDCLKIMRTMYDESVHNVITDLPWNISFDKKWDTIGNNKQYEKWTTEWATEVFRILEPGGFLLPFCGTRTYHRMVSGIENADFQIKDTISHIFGKGMPKARKINVKGWEGWQTPQLKPLQIFVCVAQKPIEGTYAKNLVKHRVGCFNIAATNTRARYRLKRMSLCGR